MAQRRLLALLVVALGAAPAAAGATSSCLPSNADKNARVALPPRNFARLVGRESFDEDAVVPPLPTSAEQRSLAEGEPAPEAEGTNSSGSRGPLGQLLHNLETKVVGGIEKLWPPRLPGEALVGGAEQAAAGENQTNRTGAAAKEQVLLQLPVRPDSIGARSSSLLQESQEEQRPNALLQQQHQHLAAARAALALDATAARHAIARLSSPADVAHLMKVGLQAVVSALKLFKSPEAEGGVIDFGQQLKEVVQSLVIPELQEGIVFLDFVEVWDLQVVALAKALKGNLTLFMETGECEVAIDAISSTLYELAGIATAMLPPKTGEIVAKFMAALVDALEGAAESVDLVQDGQHAQGVEALVESLRTAIDAVVPETVRDRDTYKSIMRMIDTEMGDIIRALAQALHVVDDTHVCWKRSVDRQRTEPELCPSGYHLMDNRWCAPDSGGERMERPQCGASTEARGKWCDLPCPPGYEPSFRHCRQTCHGNFSIDSPLMCGDAEGSIRVALIDMAAKAFHEATTSHGFVHLVIEGGLVAASELTSSLESLVELTKPFGYPRCPDDAAVAPKAEQAPKAEEQDEGEGVPKAKGAPRAEAEADGKAEAQTQADADAEAKFGSAGKTLAKAEAEAKAQAEAEAEAEEEAVAEIAQRAKSDAKAEAEAEAEAKADVEADSESEDEDEAEGAREVDAEEEAAPKAGVPHTAEAEAEAGAPATDKAEVETEAPHAGKAETDAEAPHTGDAEA